MAKLKNRESLGSQICRDISLKERKRWQSADSGGERARKSVRSTNNRFSRTIYSNFGSVCGRLCHGTIYLIHDGGEKFSICHHGQRGDPDGGAVAILRFSINQMLLKSAPYNVSSHGRNQEMPELGHEAICYNI